MEKIPTAEDFLNQNGLDVFDEGYHEIKRLCIEFAKLHVEAALKEASENAETTYDSANNVICDSESILNSYPLTNIK